MNINSEGSARFSDSPITRLQKEFTMSRSYMQLLLLTLLAAVLVLLAPASAGLAQRNPWDACERGGFSTEEDFMMTESEPFDGNPYISDGDLLSFDGQVCARNADLLAAFYEGTPPADLGLDALDMVDLSEGVVAFSTELDDPDGNFTAGDLLTTQGATIPNVALTNRFGIDYDIGLDAVHFVGDQDNLLGWLSEAADLSRGRYIENPDLLVGQLQQWGIDIWFSIEGTYRVQERLILDGDLLSALGTIVATNSSLLPATVPAGIPQRGVDFGLDAVVGPRVREDNASVPNVHFSTEILFHGEPRFTDGDILRAGNGVVRVNWELIQAFMPAADFLGLDALSIPTTMPPRDPNIQTMCGDRSVGNFGGGLILPSAAPGSGLYHPPSGDPPRQPCGEYVPIDGYLPPSGVKRFRVAYRTASDLTVPAVGTANGIRTDWRIYEWDGTASACLPTGSLNTTSDGWMDAADFLEAKLGGPSTGFCANGHLKLAVWDTASHAAGYGPADPDGHYRLWLEWEDSGSVLHREPLDHSIQLDNTEPQINDLKVTLSDGTTAVAACGEAPSGESIFKVYGDFEDDYYWGYRLRVRGGSPPTGVIYGWHDYYDGTPYVVNTDDTGTTPDATTVHLRDIDMTDLGASFTDCCYVLDLWVRDASIRHAFGGLSTNDVTGSSAWWDDAFITFAAAP
jgi:hypothetical protein